MSRKPKTTEEKTMLDPTDAAPTEPAGLGPESLIPLETIDSQDRLNPRKQYGDIVSVAAMMIARPTEYDPIWLVPNPEFDGDLSKAPMYLIVRGGRRFKGATMNNATHIRARVFGNLTMNEAEILAGVDNERPLRFASAERAAWVVGLMERHNLTPEELTRHLAENYGVRYGTSTVYQLRRFWNELHPKIRELWQAGDDRLTDELLLFLIGAESANEQWRIWELVDAGQDWRTIDRKKKETTRGRPSKPLTVATWSAPLAATMIGTVLRTEVLTKRLDSKTRDTVEAMLAFLSGATPILTLDKKPIGMRLPDGRMMWADNKPHEKQIKSNAEKEKAARERADADQKKYQKRADELHKQAIERQKADGARIRKAIEARKKKEAAKAAKKPAKSTKAGKGRK